MRTFIAIELTPEVRESLKKLQDLLKASGADVKWVEPGNIHLTLKFLGEIDEQQCQKITAVLTDVSKTTPGFSLIINAVGAFPRIQSPRVVWAGISEGSQEAGILACALEEKIAKLGIPKEERAFSAHVTLGRTRSDKGRQQLVQTLMDARDHFAGWPQAMPVSKITFFKSTLTPRGPVYDTIAQTSLATT
jgi:2'-5' RNA ligase